MPTVREWDGDPTRLLIVPDYDERNPYAKVRDKFKELVDAHGYELRPSIRQGNSKGFQAWAAGTLVGEYEPLRASAWLRIAPAVQLTRLELTDAETKEVLELLRENISYFHETLVLDHKTKPAAMAAFDANPAVTVLVKLDPDGIAEVRKNVEEYVDNYLGEGE